MADIFISYARKDLERVRPIVRLIEDAGLTVFWDRTIPAGMTWRQNIRKALDEAKCLVVIWSKYSIESNWVIEEADEARQRMILIPITIDDVIPPLGFRSIQHEDFHSWDGDPEHRKVKSLLNSVESIKRNRPKGKPLIEAVQEITPSPSAKSVLSNRISPTRHKSRDHFKVGLIVVFSTVFLVGVSVWLYVWISDHGKPATPPVIEPSVKTPSEMPDEKSSPPQSFTNSIGMKFVLVPAGTFTMGSDNRPGGQPAHRVKIRKPFYLQTTEVTQNQWKEVMSDNPSKFTDCGDDCPVEKVGSNDIKDFIAKINEKVKEQYRLPTEAEWEYAARSGGKNQTYAGGEYLDELGWYAGNSGMRTNPVGKLGPNGLGLHDMSGNVVEWVEDDWHSSYIGAPTQGSAWIDYPRNTRRISRGGSYGSLPKNCRTDTRSDYPADTRYGSLGFRLAKSVNPSP